MHFSFQVTPTSYKFFDEFFIVLVNRHHFAPKVELGGWAILPINLTILKLAANKTDHVDITCILPCTKLLIFFLREKMDAKWDITSRPISTVQIHGSNFLESERIYSNAGLSCRKGECFDVVYVIAKKLDLGIECHVFRVGLPKDELLGKEGDLHLLRYLANFGYQIRTLLQKFHY